MKHFRFLVCVLGIMIGQGLHAQFAPVLKDPRFEAFRREVGLDARLAKIKTGGEIVQTPPPGLEGFPSLKDWIGDGESLGAGVLKRHYRKGGQHVSVEYVYKNDIDDIANVMMSLAHNTSSSTLPYKLGPEDLGDFSLIGRYKIVRDVVFIRKNVMVHVSKNESDFDIVGLARWIDEHLTLVPREVMTRQIPVPKGVSVRWPGSSRVAHVAVRPEASALPVQAKVGEMLLIHLDPPGGTDPKGFDLRQKYDASMLELHNTRDIGPMDWPFKPLKPGTTVYRYVLTDLRTLLPFSGEITIEIQP